MSDTTYCQQMFSLIDAWRASGLTQKVFCTEKGITGHRFNYWHTRYKDQHKASVQTGPAFIPLSVIAQAPAAAELVYPDGRRLLFHQGVDAAYLKALLA